jgi:transposase
MPTLSLDLRQRILATYDQGKATREEVAKRFCVSLGMVKKLLQQRSRITDIRPQHHRSGRKPKMAAHHDAMRQHLAAKPDLTLRELRALLALSCSLPAIHYALAKLGLTYKKRLSAPASKTGPISPKHGKSGKSGRPASIPRSSSSSTNRARKRT